MTVKTTRRTFIKQAAVAGTAGSLILSGKARGGNGRKLRHAAIGVARRGAQDLAEFVAHPDFELAALCDVDQHHLEQAAKRHPGVAQFREAPLGRATQRVSEGLDLGVRERGSGHIAIVYSVKFTMSIFLRGPVRERAARPPLQSRPSPRRLSPGGWRRRQGVDSDVNDFDDACRFQPASRGPTR